MHFNNRFAKIAENKPKTIRNLVDEGRLLLPFKFPGKASFKQNLRNSRVNFDGQDNKDNVSFRLVTIHIDSVFWLFLVSYKN